MATRSTVGAIALFAAAAAAVSLEPPVGETPAAPTDTPAAPTVVQVRVDGGHVVGETDSGYVSYDLDWWPPNEGARPEGWGPHATVLEVDLDSPKLRMLVSALAPAYLRIGGSLDKQVVYDVGLPGANADCSARAGTCLNASRWDAIHGFAKATGSRVVFGLSFPELPGSPGRLNSSQAAALFNYSRARGYSPSTTLFGFELGEELTQYELGTPAFNAYTASYHTAAGLLRSVWGSDPASRPKLMGPCPGMSWPQLATWYPAFLRGTAGALDVSDYHSYNQIVVTPPRVLYLNTTVPSGNLSTQHGASPGATGWQGAAQARFARDAGLPLWLGEFGPHNGGGGGTFASTWISSFWYLDALGTLAELNHSVLARQTLVGGNYELLRCSSGQGDGPEPGAGCDFEPHPDYWVAVLWKRLMGTTVLPAPALAASGGGGEGSTAPLRVHAHCTAGARNGSVTLSFSNADDAASFELDLGGVAGSHGSRVEYHLAAADAAQGADARSVKLNGKTLAVGAAASLPPLQGAVVADGAAPVRVAPLTLGFVVLPGAGAEACK